MKELYERINDIISEVNTEKNRLIKCKNESTSYRDQLIYQAQICAHAEDLCKLIRLKGWVEVEMMRGGCLEYVEH